MAVVSTTFPAPAPKILLFSFVDVITGTGYITLYGVDVIAGAGPASVEYRLQQAVIFGNSGFITKANAALDLDFDILFDKSITFEGDAFTNLWMSTADDLSGGVTVRINLKHVNLAGAETQIGTEISTSITVANGIEAFNGVYNIPKTRFVKGEKLRLILTADAAGAGKSIRFSHDPKNRDLDLGTAEFVSSQFILNMPIKITT